MVEERYPVVLSAASGSSCVIYNNDGCSKKGKSLNYVKGVCSVGGAEQSLAKHAR